jgi:hypothetical protein
MKQTDQVSHFVAQLQTRLREIRVEGVRLRRLIRSITAVKAGEFATTLADAEMLRVVLPSAHSMPRAICPHCQKNRALRRDRKVFYRHTPCGFVRTSDGKRVIAETGCGVLDPNSFSENEWA